MAPTITRIAPRILTDAFTALLDEIEQSAPVATDPRRVHVEEVMLQAYCALWHGVPVEIEQNIYHIEIHGQRHSVNGTCSCGQRCAARAAKKLMQLVQLQNPAPKHNGYPCIHCNIALQPSRTPAGESAYQCPRCKWTVTTIQIGETMLANGRCAHCGRAMESTDAGVLDMIAYSCPEMNCAGYTDYYTSIGAH